MKPNKFSGVIRKFVHYSERIHNKENKNEQSFRFVNKSAKMHTEVSQHLKRYVISRQEIKELKEDYQFI